MALCWTGDTTLLAKSDKTFVVGLGSFLAGHACYATAFVRSGGFAGLKRLPSKAISAAALMAVGASTILPRAGELTIPVAGYIGLISTMAALAAGTGRRDSAIGGALFDVSDPVAEVGKIPWIAAVTRSRRRRRDGAVQRRPGADLDALYTAGQAQIVRALPVSGNGASAGE